MKITMNCPHFAEVDIQCEEPITLDTTTAEPVTCSGCGGEWRIEVKPGPADREIDHVFIRPGRYPP